MAASFTTGTLNANGLQDEHKKRIPLFFWLKSKKTNVIFLQETHCSSFEQGEAWSREWGSKNDSLWSTCSSNSKGVAVLFNFECDFEIKNECIDPEGRYIYFDLIINDEEFRLVNIYAPNNSTQRINFFKNMPKWVNVSDRNLIGGDYNCVQNYSSDRLNCVGGKDDEGLIELSSCMNKCNLEDVWRRRHPNDRMFTFSRAGKRSRLDYWLISKTLDADIKGIDLIPCVYSDHDMVVLTVKTENFCRGPGAWKMNSSVIKSDLFRKCFTSFWPTWQNKKIFYPDKGLWWDLGKKKIKEISIWCSKKLKEDHDFEKTNLELQLKKLKENPLSDHNEIYYVEEKLRILLEKDIEGSRIRSRVKWFEDGEQSSKFFHSIEKSKAKNKDFLHILDENKILRSGTSDVMQVQVDFYSKLYSSEGIDYNERNYFGQFITRNVSDDNFNKLNSDISFVELTSALKKMKTGKSPGPDGIITEFYKLYWNHIGQDLFDVFIGCYESNELTYSQYVALIILLYKKGIREDIRNWRPISLSNSDVKILSKLLAERLKIVLPEIIHSDQFGCVKDRKISHCIRLIDDVLEKMNNKNLMLLTDKMKAFDLVEWEWLFFVLKRFGIGDYFINWIRIMYNGMKSAVMTNGYISVYFNLTRGIRQGDSLSALLYIIQSEPLSACFRHTSSLKGIDIFCDNRHISEIRGTQYVDDSTNMLDNSSYIPECLNIVKRFGKASGSRINTDKTVALVSNNFVVDSCDNNMSDISFQSGIDKILGVPLGSLPCINRFWNDKINKMRSKIDFWKIRDLSMIGRIYVIKSVILPLIFYGVAHVHIDKTIVARIQDMVWNFVWNWGTCMVSHDILYLPRSLGGLNYPNFSIMIKAARIKMVIEVMRSQADWNTLAKIYFKVLDSHFLIENFALLADDYSPELIDNSNIPDYYKDCLLAFKELSKKGRVTSFNEIICYNSRIIFNGKPFELKYWHSKGLKYVSDVVNNGHVDMNLILSKFHLSRNRAHAIFEYTKLRKCITPEMINLAFNANPPEFSQLQFYLPYERKTVNVFDLTTKDIYAILLSPEKIVHKSELYWCKKLERDDIDFDLWYKNLFMSKYLPKKVQVFNWRIFNNQVLTGGILRFMKFSEKCAVCKCNDTIEDRIHLFVNCTTLIELWKIIDGIFNNLGFEPLSLYDRIIGFYENAPNNELKNVILSLARWRIWKRRCSFRYQKGYNPKVSVSFQFKCDLKTHIDVILRSTLSTKIDTDMFKKVLTMLV